MKKPSAFLFCLLIIIWLLSSCNLPQPATPTTTSSDMVASQVAMTLSALTAISPSDTPLTAPPLSEPTNTITIEPSATYTSAFTPTITPTITVTPTITLTQEATNTPIPIPGTISGNISGYPYGAIPSLTIVAYGQEKPYYYSYLVTAPGTAYFSLNNNYILPGPYQVVAYDSSDRRGGCPGLVTVISEQTVTCNITDWAGSYPARPSGVPLP